MGQGGRCAASALGGGNNTSGSEGGEEKVAVGGKLSRPSVSGMREEEREINQGRKALSQRNRRRRIG